MPTPCCRRASGAATARRRNRQRLRRARGVKPAPMPSVLAQAALEGQQSGDLRVMVGILDADPKDRLAAALARLGRAFLARGS